MFLHLNKNFSNFHKRGQRLIVRCIKGPDYGLVLMFTFFYFEVPKYMHVLKNTLPSLTDLCTWINISWKWANMLIKLAWDGKCRLALFQVIRNFLANKIYHFSRLSHQMPVSTFLPGRSSLRNWFLIQPLIQQKLFCKKF